MMEQKVDRAQRLLEVAAPLVESALKNLAEVPSGSSYAEVYRAVLVADEQLRAALAKLDELSPRTCMVR